MLIRHTAKIIRMIKMIMSLIVATVSFFSYMSIYSFNLIFIKFSKNKIKTSVNQLLKIKNVFFKSLIIN